MRYVDLETSRNKLRQKPTIQGNTCTDGAGNRTMSVLRHLLTKAVEWEMAESSPFDKGKSLILKEHNKRLRFLSEEEIERLLAECPDYLRDVVESAINSGMRRKEMLTLK